MNRMTACVLMATSILIYVTCTIVKLCGFDDVVEVLSLHTGCGPLGRIAWQITHLGIWHLLVNLVAMTTICFGGYRLPKFAVPVAFSIGLVAPATSHPTVGMSCIIYVLLGMLSIQAQRKLIYNAWGAAFIALGFFTNSNVIIHTYGYLAGIAIALIAGYRSR